jgi:uncharacterized protein
MDYQHIIDQYYPPSTPLRDVLLRHSRDVADKALLLSRRHPELQLDNDFLLEAAMLHDIGIFQTNAPGIYCMGPHPYICHGVLGAELMRQHGFPRHARVCERHTGAGLTVTDIERQDLPLPHQDFLPETMEEQLICFADNFFSKSRLGEEKTTEHVRRSLGKFGEEGVARFDAWCKLFL